MGIGSMARFIETSKVLIDNAGAVPELAAALAGFGYGEERLAEGSKLWAETEALVRKQTKVQEIASRFLVPHGMDCSAR
jgi:hypothetical protein